MAQERGSTMGEVSQKFPKAKERERSTDQGLIISEASRVTLKQPVQQDGQF